MQPIANTRQRASSAPTESALREVFEGLSPGGGPVRGRLLEGNLEAWAARWKMLADATSTIDAQYFAIEKDVFGFAFLGHLLHARRRGVKVRLMTDGLSDFTGKHSFTMTLRGQDYLQELVGAGAEVGVFQPGYMRPLGLLWDTALLGSNHDKILVIDGRLSMTGGRNIGREYLVDPEDIPVAWRDTDVLLDGRGTAAGLTHAFDREFDRWVVDDVRVDLYNFSTKDAELLGAYLMMDAWLSAPRVRASGQSASADEASLREQMVDELVAGAVSKLPEEGITRPLTAKEIARLRVHAEELVRYPKTRGSARSYDSEAQLHDLEVRILDQTTVVSDPTNTHGPALLELIGASRKRILMESAYVVPTEEMIEALADASARGVEIVIATNSARSTDSSVIQALFFDDWAHLLARIPTLRIFAATGDRKMHWKTFIFDDEVTLVTGYNMDFLSAHVDGEVGALIWSKSFADVTYEGYRRDFENPGIGFVEYRIRRDAHGRAVLEDGKPVVELGPADYLAPEVLARDEKRRRLWRQIRKLPYFESIQRPDLVPQPREPTPPTQVPKSE